MERAWKKPESRIETTMPSNADFMHIAHRRVIDRERVVRQRLAATLEKLDRIIIGKKDLRVRWDTDPKVIAYNKDGNIFLGEGHFSDLHDIDTVVAVLGANYHEVAHLLFSPLANSEFSSYIKSEDILFRAFNYLEDARIEALFVARYETAKKYFLSTFLDVMLKTSSHDSMFLIAHGRRFVPLDVRTELEEMFKVAHSVSDEDMENFKRIIDSYRRLDNRKFSKYGSATRLVAEFAHLLKKYGSVQDDSNTCNNAQNSSSSSDENAVDEAQVVAAETNIQDDKEEQGEDGSGINDGTTEENDTENGDGEGDNSSDLDSEEGDDEESDSPADGSEGKGKRERLEDKALEIKELVLEDEIIREQVERISVSIRSTTTEFSDLEKARGMVECHVPTELKRISVLAETELRRLYSELEGGWKYGTDDGVLNVERASMPDVDLDEIYDKWDEGQQTDVGIEMVILLDTSMSMEGVKIQAAEKAMWVLKRALDEIEARVTVISFDENTGVVYRPDEHVTASKMLCMRILGGSTLPAEGMQIARRRLQDSTEPNKIFVIITDGQWSFYAQEGVDTISTSLGNMPGTKVYIGIKQACAVMHANDFDINKVISDPFGVVEIVRNLVNQILREAKR